MKTFLLLILSLMTGCEASSMVKGCRGGWVNFTHGYPDRNTKIQHIDLVRDNHENPPILQTNQKNVWISDGRFSVYHDTESRNIQVGIKDIQQKNFEEYELKFRREHGPNNKDKEEVDLKSDKGCQEPLIITVSRTAEANISCDKGNKDDFRVRFFCKENGPICEDVLSTKSALRSNGSFTLTETERGFTVSISDVSAQHAGVYWCGVESTVKISYRAALRKIQLKVEGVSSFHIFTAGGVCAALLGLLLLLVLGYKKYWCSKNKRNGEAHNEEDRAYDEFKERPQVPGPGTVLKSFYVNANAPTNPSAAPNYSTINAPTNPSAAPYYSTINAPTNPSASPYYSTINAPTNPSATPYYSTINAPTNPSAAPNYSTINAPNISAEAGGDTYSTVRDQAQCPTYSTVDHPSRLPEYPFYSTVNHPQQT